MKNKILKNFGLKILAFITAIVLWLIVVNIDDPVISTTFSGVPVEILNANLLTSEGKVYEVLEDTDNISVTVAAKRTILDYLNNGNLHATADMQELNETDGTIRIRVESNRYSNQIDSMKAKTEYLKIKIENKKNAQFPIEAVVLGKPQDGYVKGNVSMNQNIVYVSGPESVVSQIAKVTTEVSVEGMASNVSTSMKLKYYDKDGTLLDDSRFSQNITSVDLYIEILKTKEVPIVAGISGVPMTGYGVDGISVVEPANVVIAGKSTVLNEISSIQIPDDKVNVDGINGDLNVAVKLGELLPEGVVLADGEDDGKVIVTVKIKELSIQMVELAKSRISITGVPEGYTADLGTSTEVLTFDVMGMEEQLKNLNMSQVTATVDVNAYMEEKDITKLEENTYLLPVSLTLPEGITERLPVSVSVKFETTQ